MHRLRGNSPVPFLVQKLLVEPAILRPRGSPHRIVRPACFPRHRALFAIRSPLSVDNGHGPCFRHVDSHDGPLGLHPAARHRRQPALWSAQWSDNWLQNGCSNHNGIDHAIFPGTQIRRTGTFRDLRIRRLPVRAEHFSGLPGCVQADCHCSEMHSLGPRHSNQKPDQGCNWLLILNCS